MIYSTSIFPILDEQLRASKMTRKMLSEKAEINYDTLGNKLRGSSEFTRPEMYRIKKILSEILKKELFLDCLFTTGSENYDTGQHSKIEQ